jgi:luciferase family oxidoreductase group 1
MRALRRDRIETEADFPRDVAELQRLLGPRQPDQQVVAVPGAGTEVPIWLLGSSLFSARLAAERGLPYAFASHFAPALLLQAIEIYRHSFKPSAKLAKPTVIIGVPVIAAPTDDEADFLATSTFQRVLGILRGDRRPLPPPVAGFFESLHPQERAGIADFLGAAVIGGPDTVRDGLRDLHAATGADEMMLVSDIFDPELRLRSLDIATRACWQP